MEAQAITVEHASAMPAPTWHFLKMNDSVLEIPAGLAISPDVSAVSPWRAKGASDEFENALADAQVAWEAAHPEPTAAEVAQRAAFLAAEADATYGGTAQSAYQIAADAIEEARSLAIAFEHGTGEEVAAYLRYAAGERIVIVADAGCSADARVVVRPVRGAISAAAIDVIANPRSEVNLSVVMDGAFGEEVPQPETSAGEAGTRAVVGTTIRIFADDGSRVNVVRTQALPQGCSDVDDMGLHVGARAVVDVRQTVLGAADTHTGLAGDLRGESARVNVDTHYLGHGLQVHDFNYVLRHHGPKTECDLKANGVLAGKSRKTLRGTIDLIRGAKGAVGSENETVLLVDEDVQNKTIPVILCNEDDVAGNHGATIGHIRDEQLFYLASRGLSKEAAEKMFVSAMLEQATIEAPDEDARRAVLACGEGVAPGFASLFDEEA